MRADSDLYSNQNNSSLLKLTRAVLIMLLAAITACEPNKTLPNRAQSPTAKWLNVEAALRAISPDDKVLLELVNVAKHDAALTDPKSSYYQRFSALYDEQFLDYLEILDDDALPGAVFLSLMYASGSLFNFDWKSIYQAQALTRIFNLALTTSQLAELEPKEIERITLVARSGGADFDPVIQAQTIVRVLESMIMDRDKRILWLSGGGDYYEFLIVSPDVAKKLNALTLSVDLTFASPSSEY
jgi:hypothetical protein